MNVLSNVRSFGKDLYFNAEIIPFLVSLAMGNLPEIADTISSLIIASFSVIFSIISRKFFGQKISSLFTRKLRAVVVAENVRQIPPEKCIGMIEKVTINEAIASAAESGDISNFLGLSGTNLRKAVHPNIQRGTLKAGESVVLNMPRYKMYHFVEYSSVGISLVVVSSFKLINIVGGFGTVNTSTEDTEGKLCLIPGEDTVTIKNNRSTTVEYQLFRFN